MAIVKNSSKNKKNKDCKMIMSKRINWIDCAKGIGIFLIVIGHVLTNGYFRKIIYSVNVPLFFYLSGICFKERTNSRKYIIDKIKKILIPYYIVSILSIILFCFFQFMNNELNGLVILKNLLSMLYANSNFGYMKWNQPLWFLPCFLVTNILIHFIYKNKNVVLRNIILYSLVFVGHIISLYKIFLPFHLETSLCMLFWMNLGIISQRFDFNSKVKFNFKSICFIFVIMVVGIIFSLINSTVSIRTDFYGNLLIYYFVAMIFIVIIQFISNKSNKLLELYGRNTLYVLLFHKFPILFFQMFFPLTKNILVNGNNILCIIVSIFVSIVCISICILIAYFIKRKKGGYL